MRKAKSLTIKYKDFQLAALIYLLLPIVVFILGNIKLLIAIPAVALLAVCVCLSARNNKDSRSLEVPYKYLTVALILVMVLTISSGIGEFVFSTEDHAFRRAIFRDLINYKWPVFFDASTQSNPVIANYFGEGNAAFVYYFTFWMVPSLVGKLLGFTAGNVALVIWSFIGLTLVLLGMNFFVKRCTYGSLFMLAFAGGMDIIPFFINSRVGMPDYGWLEGYTANLSYLSNMTNLMNVFNQCIPCWLVAVLLITCEDNRIIGLIGASLLAYSPWATIGVLPVAVCVLLNKREQISVKRIFAVNNVAPVVINGLIFGLFFMASSGEAMVKGFTWTFYDNFGSFVLGWLLIILIEIVPFVLLSNKKDIKTPIYITSIATLLVIPVYMVSLNNDFCMRASMPALFILCVYVARNIPRITVDKISSLDFSIKQIGAGVILVAMMAISLYYAYVGFAMTLLGEFPRDDIGSLADINDTLYASVIKDQFYSYDYADSLYFKYLSR